MVGPPSASMTARQRSFMLSTKRRAKSTWISPHASFKAVLSSSAFLMWGLLPLIIFSMQLQMRSMGFKSGLCGGPEIKVPDRISALPCRIAASTVIFLEYEVRILVLTQFRQPGHHIVRQGIGVLIYRAFTTD